ncbi:hypothetical protein PO909_009005 [Leuciscus waleckii]
MGGEEVLLRDQFLLGLREGPVRQSLRVQFRRTPNLTFEELRREALALERDHTENVDPPSCLAKNVVGTPSTTTVPDWKKALREELKRDVREQMSDLSKSVMEELRRERLQLSSLPRERAYSDGNRPPDRRPSRPSGSRFQWDEHGRPICNCCGEPGHYFRQCPARRASRLVGRCPVVVVQVNDQEVQCLLDTGSQVTLFTESLAHELFGAEGRPPAEAPWLTLRGANGLDIPYVGYLVTDLKIHGVVVSQKGVVVVRDACLRSHRALIGMNVISDCWEELFRSRPARTAATSAGQEWDRIRADCRRVCLAEQQGTRESTGRVACRYALSIPAQSEAVVWSRLPPRLYSPEEWVMRLVRVTSVRPQQVREQGEVNFNRVSPTVVEVALARAGPGAGETGRGLPAHLMGESLRGEGLGEEQLGQLQEFLVEWQHLFSTHDEDYGRTDVVRHQIPTGDAAPSRERYRPVPPTLYSEVRTLLRGMLDKGIIRESSSSWAAPIVLVRKKTGSWRFCVDYRRLNQVTKRDAFPLPRVEDSLTSLTQATWYSTLDLASGYWQVQMDEHDREKTAFTTPFGLYEWDRMPFGLCNAPATFQRLMQRCLGSQLMDTTLVYLDDVIVYSPDFKSHLEHLEQVFRSLERYGLKLQPDKCQLFHKEVKFLGHVVSAVGISVDPEKVVAV